MAADIRKPFVRFEVRSVEDRAASVEKGFYCTKDVDFIIIIPHGSEGKTVLEYEYSEWLARSRPTQNYLAPGAGADTPLVMASRFPADWVKEIEAGYQAWKEGRELPLEGTPLLNWPVVNPAMRNVCIGLHIRTVEELAVATDDTIERLGMGAVHLRQRARDWLGAQGAAGGPLAAELEKLREENRAKDVRLESLEAQLKTLLEPKANIKEAA